MRYYKWAVDQASSDGKSDSGFAWTMGVEFNTMTLKQSNPTNCRRMKDMQMTNAIKPI
jgi:hypothetical protein